MLYQDKVGLADGGGAGTNMFDDWRPFWTPCLCLKWQKPMPPHHGDAYAAT